MEDQMMKQDVVPEEVPEEKGTQRSNKDMLNDKIKSKKPGKKKIRSIQDLKDIAKASKEKKAGY